MILLDPDLGPDPAPDPSPQSRPAKAATPAGISTRSLALFLRKARPALRLRGQVSVLLTTDAAIRKLNRQFRGKNKATDVLSFPADAFIQQHQKIAGDLAISVETARNQADACGHSLGTELKILMLHGLLHLAGYDHETDNGEMAKREGALRAKFELPLGLIERAASDSARSFLPTLAAKDAARMGQPARRRKP
jgi:probable rRNA maturation factor